MDYGDGRDGVVKRAYDFWKVASTAEQENRERGLAALKFAQGDQWDDKLVSTRDLDGRPSESYNQIPNFVNQVVNDGRMNMPQTRFIAGEDGKEEDATKMEDLARNIQSQSDAEIAYDTALYGQTVNGWGWWRYVTEYENAKSFDRNQIIKIKPIWNPFTVYDDPFAISADKLDRKRLIQIEDVKRDDFNDTYDKDYDSVDLESIGDACPGWATSDSIRIAEYWELTEKTSKLYRHKKTKVITEKTPKAPEDYESRDVITPKVMWYKINGKEVLDKAEWPGIYIPYVRVVGNETNIDGKSYVTGMVERLMPAQRQMNYWLNAATEAMALAPKSPWIVDPAGMGQYQQYWDQANVRNYAYLPYASFDDKLQPLRAPVRSDSSTNLNGFVVMVQQSQQNFYNLSGIFPASLGQASNEKSGRAILARQKEGDVSTFHIHDNMARGQRAGGRIMADLIPKIYDAARKVTGRKEDGTTYVMPINQKYKDGDEQKMHDFTTGTYDVAVTTGPSYSTKRMESSEFYTQLIQSYPDLAQVIGDIAIGASDAAGADRAAERMKRFIQMNSPGLIEEDNKKDKIPPQVQAQLQQADQIIQEMQAQLQQAQQALADKQADVQAKQADLQLKAQQMQLNAADSERQFELDSQQKQLDAKKLELEEMKIQLEAAKLQMPQGGSTAKQQSPSDSSPTLPADDENVLSARIMTLQELRAKQEQDMIDRQMQEQVDEQMEQQRALIEQQTAEMRMQYEMQKEQAEQSRAEMMMQTLAGIQQSVNALTSSVLTPKEVVRDATGRPIGIQPVTRVVN